MEVSIALLWLFSIVVYVEMSCRKERARKRSLERYKAATLAVCAAAVALFFTILIGILAGLLGNTSLSLILLTVGAPCWVLNLVKDLSDDDWRDGLSRRLRRRVRTLRQDSRLVPRLSLR